ncbi:retrotransposon unclassified [Hordeum vulgare]|nr:retrotransposon unclassified [Hordeum vulgare]
MWPGAVAKRPASKAVYPFFLHSVLAGLVSAFSSFFTGIMDHYGIQTLHLQPNSILLLSVFAFYCEAFVGLRPSVALFCHFFSLRLHDGARLWACVSFIAAQSGNLLLKAGKKVENFRHP